MKQHDRTKPELFIGGPEDGKWKAILYGTAAMVVVEEPSNSSFRVPGEINLVKYHRYGFEVVHDTYKFFWALEGLSAEAAFEKLLKGYKPEQ